MLTMLNYLTMLIEVSILFKKDSYYSELKKLKTKFINEGLIHFFILILNLSVNVKFILRSRSYDKNNCGQDVSSVRGA